MGSLDLDYISKIITLIIALATVLGLLWRFFITPLTKFAKTLKQNSEKISDALPVLFELSRLWPEAHSPGSLKAFINGLDVDMSISRAWIHVLIDSFNIAAFETDGEGMCTWTSERWQDLSGMSLDESLKDGWVSGVAPEDRLYVFKEWKDCVRDRRIYDIRYNIYDVATNKRTPVRGRGLVVRDNTGNVFGYVGMLIELNKSSACETVP